MTSYLFRLTFSAPKNQVFPIPSATCEFSLPPNTVAILVARNAETLADATSLHIQVGGFPDAATARLSGERLRQQLRILNAVLHLGLNIPVGDTVSSQAAESVKIRAKEKSGETIVDSVRGVNVFPDDGEHFEAFPAGQFSVFPSDATHALKSLAEMWKLDLSLDERSEEALNLLGAARNDASPRTAFLATYLAMEILVVRRPRSDAAKALLKSIDENIAQSSLQDSDKASLRGAISKLNEESYGAAFRRLATGIQEPKEIAGYPVADLLRISRRVRNDIAHGAHVDASIDISKLGGALRTMALMLIWSRCKLPSFTTQRPASSIRADHMEIRVL